jgi:hypothetical protein
MIMGSCNRRYAAIYRYFLRLRGAVKFSEIPNQVFTVVSKSKMAQYKGAAREGQRAAHLMKKREKQKEELELLKKKIADVCCGLNIFVFMYKVVQYIGTIN